MSVTSPAAYVPPSSIVVTVADADHATDRRPAGIGAGVVSVSYTHLRAHET